MGRHIFYSYLIFGFIFDLSSKMVQLETCLRLEDGGMQNPAPTLRRSNVATLARHDVEVQRCLTCLHHPTSRRHLELFTKF